MIGPTEKSVMDCDDCEMCHRLKHNSYAVVCIHPDVPRAACGDATPLVEVEGIIPAPSWCPMLVSDINTPIIKAAEAAVGEK
jgi:hypothetical protein